MLFVKADLYIPQKYPIRQTLPNFLCSNMEIPIKETKKEAWLNCSTRLFKTRRGF